MLEHNFTVKKRVSVFWHNQSSISTTSSLKTRDLGNYKPSIPVTALACGLMKNKSFIKGWTHFDHQQRPSPRSMVMNLRGRPTESFPNQTISYNDSDPIKEELFYFSGNMLVIPDSQEDIPEDSLTLQHIPFSYSINTVFERYENDGSILHRLETNSKGLTLNVLETITPYNLSALFPLVINEVRLGFETYKTKVFGGIFGRIANIQKRFYLEIRKDEIYVFTEDAATQAGKLPLSEEGLIKTLDRHLTQLNLYKSFKQDLETSPEVA